MKKFSEELKPMLTGFIVGEIGSKGLDSITYALKIKNDKNSVCCDNYIRIREEADRCGYNSDEVFRVHELVNGYIFDVDMQTMTKVMTDIAKSSIAITGKHQELLDSVYREPEQVRKRELVRLARAIMRAGDDGDTSIDVALFNCNTTDKVSYTVEDSGKNKCVSLPAYGMRHWDLKTVNEKLLIDKGYRISKANLKYILPSQNGVHATIEFERV